VRPWGNQQSYITEKWYHFYGEDFGIFRHNHISLIILPNQIARKLLKISKFISKECKSQLE
jgi:hypothetical protein